MKLEDRPTPRTDAIWESNSITEVLQSHASLERELGAAVEALERIVFHCDFTSELHASDEQLRGCALNIASSVLAEIAKGREG